MTNMKKIILGLLIAFSGSAFATTPGNTVIVNKHAGYGIIFDAGPTDTITFKSAVASAKACAAGYTRTSPNYCVRDVGASLVALTRDACTEVASPAAAVMVDIHLKARVVSGNGVGERNSKIAVYNENTCTTNAVLSATNDVDVTVYEPTALVGWTLANQYVTYTFPPVSTGAALWRKKTDDATNTSLGWYGPIGYHD